MRNRIGIVVGLVLLLTNGTGAPQTSKSGEGAAPNGVPVHMVATVEPLQDSDSSVAVLEREDVQVRQGKIDSE